MGSAPFSSTRSGAPVVPVQGSPSSRHRQQKRDWRMLRLRGFLAGVWVPAGGHKGGEGYLGYSQHRTGGQVSHVWVLPQSPRALIRPRPPSARPSCPAKQRCQGSVADTSAWCPPAAPHSAHPTPRATPVAPPARPETLQEGAGLSPRAAVGSGPLPAVPTRGARPHSGGRGVRGRGLPEGGGAYARSFPRLQTTPSSHWPTRVHRGREANQDEAPAPGRRSRSPHWRSEGKLRQRSCSFPPRAPGAARRFQRPHRCRRCTPPWLCPPSGGPGSRPRSGEPVGKSSHWGRGPFPHLLLLALAASQARETSSGPRQTPLA